MRPGWICLFLLGSTLNLSGCENAETQPALVKVHGTVTYLDRPLAGGTIVFIPDEERGTVGALIHADIRTNGTYSLQTGEHEGVAPGSYRVTVRLADPTPDRSRQTWPQPPERYSDPRTSGLSCKVQAVELHTINFHLQ